MSNQHQATNRQGVARALATTFALLVGPLSLAACTMTAGEELGTSEAELALPSTCCEGGTYTCNSIDYEIDYWTPRSSCGSLTKPRAQARCEAVCGAPCMDTGWVVTCF
jgi:hypothetical protein